MPVNHHLLLSKPSASRWHGPRPDTESDARLIPLLCLTGVAAIFIFCSLFTANPLLSVLASSIPPLLVWLLWRVGEPPVLLFGCGMQWAQIVSAVFFANQQNRNIAQTEPSLQLALLVSLTSIVALAFGMRFALLKLPSSDSYNQIPVLSAATLFVVYVVFFFGAILLQTFAFHIPRLTQVMIGLSTFKWVAVYMLFLKILRTRRSFGLLGIVLLVEFANGLGFFSGFKFVFFVLLIVVLSFPGAWRARYSWMYITCAGLLLSFGFLWLAIRADYRRFMSHGSGSQEIKVSYVERFAWLKQRFERFTVEDFREGAGGFEGRYAWGTLLTWTIENVPANVPHENGRLSLAALKHLLTPRVLFPNKEPLHDSLIARKYTGVQVAGPDEGASIGIGYIGELYVDFGFWLMHAGVLLLGCFYGLIYRRMATRTSLRPWRFACATAILFVPTSTPESALAKLLGGVILSWLVMEFALHLARRVYPKLFETITYTRGVARDLRRRPCRSANANSKPAPSDERPFHYQ